MTPWTLGILQSHRGSWIIWEWNLNSTPVILLWMLSSRFSEVLLNLRERKDMLSSWEKLRIMRYHIEIDGRWLGYDWIWANQNRISYCFCLWINYLGTFQIVGAFCLTELSHGSNTSKIQTTATFDKGEFVFHTPNIGATKCWAGNLGKVNYLLHDFL